MNSFWYGNINQQCNCQRIKASASKCWILTCHLDKDGVTMIKALIMCWHIFTFLFITVLDWIRKTSYRNRGNATRQNAADVLSYREVTGTPKLFQMEGRPWIRKWKGGHELGSAIGTTSEVQLPVADWSSFFPPPHHILIFVSYSKSQYCLLPDTYLACFMLQWDLISIQESFWSNA